MEQNILLAAGQEQSAGRDFDPILVVPVSVEVICKPQNGTQSLEAKLNGEWKLPPSGESHELCDLDPSDKKFT